MLHCETPLLAPALFHLSTVGKLCEINATLQLPLQFMITQHRYHTSCSFLWSLISYHLQYHGGYAFHIFFSCLFHAVLSSQVLTYDCKHPVCVVVLLLIILVMLRVEYNSSRQGLMWCIWS